MFGFALPESKAHVLAALMGGRRKYGVWNPPPDMRPWFLVSFSPSSTTDARVIWADGTKCIAWYSDGKWRPHWEPPDYKVLQKG